MQTMKLFTGLLATAERVIARAHLFIHLDWKDDLGSNTLD